MSNAGISKKVLLWTIVIIGLVGMLLFTEDLRAPFQTTSVTFNYTIDSDVRQSLNSSKNNLPTVNHDMADKNKHTKAVVNIGKVEPDVITNKRTKGDVSNSTFRRRRPGPIDLMKKGPFDFLPNFRNPCWSSQNLGGPPIRCLPYFFLVGAPKSGTTDLFRRLSVHPKIAKGVPKEPHWLTRFRFTSKPHLTNYLDYFKKGTQAIFDSSDKKGYHPLVFGDCSASTLWDNSNWIKLPWFRNMSEPPLTNSDYIHHLNPKTKILVILRNPIERLYSDYLYFESGENTPSLFHDAVLKAVNSMELCLHERDGNYRYCLHTKPKFRIRIGIYHHHLKEYYRVFPREQVMVIKLEEFSNHTADDMDKIFNFLELGPLTGSLQEKAANSTRRANSRHKTDKKVGDMLPETRTILQNFYKEHNDQLGELLGENFNYNNDEKKV